MQFGDKLSALLEEKALTQKDFAAMLNIAPTTLNGYIKNKRQPDLELLKQMAFYLQCSVDFLLDVRSDTTLSIKEHALIEYFRLLSPDEQAMLLSLAKISVNKKTRRN